MILHISKTTVHEISTTDFRKEASKLRPQSDPIFKLGDIVNTIVFMGAVIPAMVIGFHPTTGGWMYHLARPRISDGVWENVSAAEKDLKLVQALTADPEAKKE